MSDLKARSGGDIAIFPGARLAQTALSAGGIDELALLVVPELFGHGTPPVRGA